jgi:hypothetical protein
MTEVRRPSLLIQEHEDGLVPSFDQDQHAENGASSLQVERISDQSTPEVPYQILNSPELRIKYLRLTDDLVQSMIQQETEVAVFLDKSARPVAWLMHALWDQLAPPAKPDGTSYKEPEIKFVNIDREQWEETVGRSEVGTIDVNAIPANSINTLRKVFAETDQHPTEEDSYTGPTMLTDKKVMIIDEVSVSGDTLWMAHGIFKRAFPDAKAIVPKYWMSGQVRQDAKSGVRINTELPVWYSDREVTGRLVANRDVTKSRRSPSSRQRLGGLWLSTNFRERDYKGLQLRAETGQMARDLRDHKMIYVPATSWGSNGIETIEARIARLNGISQSEYVQLRRETGSDIAALQTHYLAQLASRASIESEQN